MEKLVSIITPTYNSQQFILETYHSIIAQSHQNWEWVVTDDCSSDTTIDILTELASKDARVKVYKTEVNSGAAVARNTSLRNAKGDYIAFLDSDDLWYESKLKKQIAFMGDSINFSYTAYEIVNENGQPSGKTIDDASPTECTYYDQLKKTTTLGCSTVMLRKDAFGTIQMPNLRNRQDFALWLQLLKGGEKAYLIQEVLAKYRVVSNSISRNKFKMAQRTWHVYRKVECLTLIKSLYYFSCYAWNSVFRK